MVALKEEHEHYSVDYHNVQSTIQDPELRTDCQVVKPSTEELV